MHDSRFWRIAAVSFIAALLYVGHGLHGGARGELPSLVNVAQASGSAVQATGSTPYVYTTNAGGTQLFVWQADGKGKATCLGVADFDGRFIERQKR
jgi:anti-sigma-K factor RskA